MSNTRKAEPLPLPSRSIADILQLATPRETTVALCMDGALAAEADRIEAALDAAPVYRPGASLADVDPRLALVRELDDLRETMAASEVTFRFRALPHKEYSDLLAAHEPRDGKDEAWNVDTLPADLIARCSVDPVMSLEDVGTLFEVLNAAGRSALFTAAWKANNAGSVVPSSRAVSANPASSGSR